MVCVTGPGRARPLALASLSSGTLAMMTASASRAAVVAEFEALLEAVNAQLEAHERLDKLIVVKEPWSVECGDLTPTLKIRRAVIEERYLPDADR